eukprot:1060355-Prorocentrum_minimum.AAC.2
MVVLPDPTIHILPDTTGPCSSRSQTAEQTQLEKELVEIACEVGNIANQVPSAAVRGGRHYDLWLGFQDDLASATNIAELAVLILWLYTQLSPAIFRPFSTADGVISIEDSEQWHAALSKLAYEGFRASSPILPCMSNQAKDLHSCGSVIKTRRPVILGQTGVGSGLSSEEIVQANQKELMALVMQLRDMLDWGAIEQVRPIPSQIHGRRAPAAQRSASIAAHPPIRAGYSSSSNVSMDTTSVPLSRSVLHARLQHITDLRYGERSTEGPHGLAVSTNIWGES